MRIEGLFNRNEYTSIALPTTWVWYNWNWRVAMLHLLQAFAVIVVIIFKLSKIKANVPYVSGSMDLRWTNHAMIIIDKHDTKCSSVRDSPMFNQHVKKAFPADLMNPDTLYNFNNTFAVEYDISGIQINTPALICVFFFLSAGFQFFNGWVLNRTPDAPRVLHYLEYSLSSSLMIVILAVNVGVFEFFQLIALFGLFFGMNIFGACAEIICYIVERVEGPLCDMVAMGCQVYRVWLVPHFAGWVMFLLAFVPVFVKFCITCYCSEPMMPWFVILAVCIEFVFFLLFGYVQWWGLSKRMWSAAYVRMAQNKIEYYDKQLGDPRYAAESVTNTRFKQEWVDKKKNYQTQRQDCINKTDKYNILLSFFAKTSLAWLLLGPALSVNVGVN